MVCGREMWHVLCGSSMIDSEIPRSSNFVNRSALAGQWPSQLNGVTEHAEYSLPMKRQRFNIPHKPNHEDTEF